MSFILAFGKTKPNGCDNHELQHGSVIAGPRPLLRPMVQHGSLKSIRVRGLFGHQPRVWKICGLVADRKGTR
jgi:hypothetical protein